MLNAHGKMKRIFPYGVISTKPAIRVKPGVKMAMNRNVLRALSNPRYIQFWWSPSKKTLLIGNAADNDQSSFEVSDYSYSRKGNMNIRSIVFINAIMSATKWHGCKTYSILGEYVPELDMVAFRTEDAVETEAPINA